MGGGGTHPARYAAEMWEAAKVCKAALQDERVPMWFELGNEWNLESEGWEADPAKYAAWAKAVVRALGLWGEWKHGLFAAAVSPQDPAHLALLVQVLKALDGIVHGQALHAYDDIIGGVMEQVLALRGAGLGDYPLIGSELGSLLLATRLAEFRRVEEELPLIAWHIWIADGKSNGAWPEGYILNEQECKEME